MITLLEGMKEQVNEKHMKSQVWVDWFKKKGDIKVKTYGRFNEQSLCDLKLILPRLNPRLGGLSGPSEVVYVSVFWTLVIALIQSAKPVNVYPNAIRVVDSGASRFRITYFGLD